MVRTARQKVTHGLDRLGFRGVDDVSSAKSPGLVEPLCLDIDDDDPCGSRDARPTDRIEPNPSSPEDHDRIAGTNVRSVQDRTCTGYNAAAEERSLGERKFLGYEGKLVLMDERLFGEAAQPEALEQRNSIAAESRGINLSAQSRLRVFALERAARQTPSARSARLRQRTYNVISDMELRYIRTHGSHDPSNLVSKHRRGRDYIVSCKQQ